MSSAPDSDFRSLALVGASAFAGTMVMQDALGAATLDGDTYIKSSGGTNWALITAAKFAAVALLIACAAIHRSWPIAAW